MQNHRKERLEYTTGRNEHLENGILLCDSVLGDFHTTMIEMVSVLFLYFNTEMLFFILNIRVKH